MERDKLNELEATLKEQINYLKQHHDDDDMDEASWGYEEGVLITGNQAIEARNSRELLHRKLWSVKQ